MGAKFYDTRREDINPKHLRTTAQENNWTKEEWDEESTIRKSSIL
jgi:hypothetical protein